MEEKLQVGVISSTHGIRGEVKVFPTTDDPARFNRLKKVLLDTGAEEMTLHVESVKFFKNMVILKFREFKDINEAEKYKGKGLFVEREDAVPLEEGEYFIADLIGAFVETEDGKLLGELTDVLQTGANDVYAVCMEDGKEVLLPAIRECVRLVDISQKRIVVHLMDGLL